LIDVQEAVSNLSPPIARAISRVGHDKKIYDVPMYTNVSIVLPCYDEEQIIARTIEKVLNWADNERLNIEVIVVNDGSNDDSKAVVERIASNDKRVMLVHHEINKGYASAIVTGIDRAHHEIVGFMDSDGQFDPIDFNLLMPSLKHHDFAAGIREQRADRFHRKINASIYNFAVRFLFGVRAQDIDCGFKIFKRSIWTVIRPTIASGALLNAEIFVHLKEHEIAYFQAPIRHFPRTTGASTGANVRVIMKAALELATLFLDHVKRALSKKNPFTKPSRK
jgi:glycosyltransferase involved in cell wall biosynthesis